MDKKEIIDLIRLLAGLESWSFSAGQRLPDYLLESIDATMESLTKKLLEEKSSTTTSHQPG